MTDGIAVVIPAHNAAGTLAAALGSLQQQTQAPREIVVVDDGSTDGTAALAAQLGATVVQQQRAGPAAARNRGIAATSAPWVAFLDADDLFAPDKLERQVAWLSQLGASVGCSDAWVIADDMPLRRKNSGRRQSNVLTMERLLQENPVICSTVMARRSVLEQVGGFDEDPALLATEDFDLWLRLARQEPLAYLAEPLSFYRVHGASLSVQTRFLRGVDRILDKIENVYGDEEHFLRLVRQRRARSRLDAAWQLLADRDRRSEARRLIRDALRHSFSWSGCRMLLRSMLPAGSRIPAVNGEAGTAHLPPG